MSIPDILRKYNIKPTRFSFGATSAIITNMAIITGLNNITNAKASIIGGLLIIAIADNISDTLGIHIYKEAETTDSKEVFLTTLNNFITRLLVSLVFVFIVLIFPLNTAVYLSVIYGLLVLTLISFLIAKKWKINPIEIIIQHTIITVMIITISSYLSKIISRTFSP